METNTEATAVKRDRSKYRAAHAEELKRKSAERRQTPEHKEYMRRYHKEWYQRNKDKVAASSKEWQRNNPERAREARRRFSAKHPERARQGWKRYAERNPDKRREQVLRHREKYPARHLLRYTRTRARIYGREFTLTEQWIDEGLKLGCALSGLTFDLSRGRHARTRILGPSVDRIDCEKGYTPDNCRLICVGLNCGMADWGWKEAVDLWRAAIDKEDRHLGVSLYSEQRP